ncbi:hypothetical protein Pyn_31409 [Prunus yedoensis var. nudiflora]|uniref:Uncharacterized protein n=1 Tax=Prunus yedoensis var. nudiflora TaxID=2094558 RepID=A0A314YNI9_PRUYE|nr:hypothetical protein Pyn_31409 [Prunus yedoensis var. nudiflora]
MHFLEVKKYKLHTILLSSISAVVAALNLSKRSNVPTAELKGLIGIFGSLSHTLLLLGNLDIEGVAQLFLSAGLSPPFEPAIFVKSPPPNELRILPFKPPSLPTHPLKSGYC